MCTCRVENWGGGAPGSALSVLTPMISKLELAYIYNAHSSEEIMPT